MDHWEFSRRLGTYASREAASPYWWIGSLATANIFVVGLMALYSWLIKQTFWWSVVMGVMLLVIINAGIVRRLL